MRRRAFTSVTIGGIAVVLRGARAQPSDKVRRLTILTQMEPVDRATGKQQRYWTAFFEELRRLGHEEGRNVAVTWHSSQGDAGRAVELARSVAESRPDAIFTPDARMAMVLKTAAAAIPTVAVTFDPVASGVAASLARPGGNVTGVSIDAGMEIVGKRLEFFRQAVPMMSRLAWLAPRRIVDTAVASATREAARTAGLTLVQVVVEAPVDAAAFRHAFASMAGSGVHAVSVAAAESLNHRWLIAELALGARLPTMSAWRENVEAGGLMSYGNDVVDTFRRSADYIDRILRGANPAELPFQQTSRFELVINLKTARTLGLDIPEALLVRADEVIQ
jgi:putative ABC transport system substrate-binding protein